MGGHRAPQRPTPRSMIPPSAPLTLRPAEKSDVPLILDFIRQLAVYEKLRHEAVVTEADLHATLFGDRPAAEVVLAYLGEVAVGGAASR